MVVIRVITWQYNIQHDVDHKVPIPSSTFKSPHSRCISPMDPSTDWYFFMLRYLTHL